MRVLFVVGVALLGAGATAAISAATRADHIWPGALWTFSLLSLYGWLTLRRRKSGKASR